MFMKSLPYQKVYGRVKSQIDRYGIPFGGFTPS